MFRRRYLLLAIAILALGILVACQPQTVEVTKVVTEQVPVTVPPVVETVEVTSPPMIETVLVPATEVPDDNGDMMGNDPEPVTLSRTDQSDIPTLDPQRGEDALSIRYIENMFVNLTNYDLETADVVPEAATSWEISEDGLVYTFKIRNDIPWVYHNPVFEKTEQVTDADGNPMFVTANDFVYGIKRACDPNLGSYYSSVVAPIILGCNEVLNYEDPSAVPAELVEAIGVSAPDDETLIIELEFPASYFLSMTPMWTLAAAPQMAIDEHGDNWIEAGNIVTNGRYVLNEWVHNVRTTMLRNPLMPEDLKGTGNVDKFVSTVVPDTNTSYALWLNNEVALSGIPEPELQTHLQDYADETIQVPNLTVFYFGFRMTKAPMDNVHVRRAFSAAFDRATYLRDVRQGQGLPMTHFAPPGIFGAPPVNEVGVGYDPEYARAEMEAAGYPNCEGFPSITMIGYSGESTRNWIEFAQANISEVLGCSEDIIQIEQLPFAELLDATDARNPDEAAPHMWTLGWGPDYADENNWVGDVLWCEGETRSKRTCNEIDELIVEAREEQDQERRRELYYEIEESFFGPEGEMPFMPIYLSIAYTAKHSWYDFTPALFGGPQIYNHTIDQAAQMEAMGK